MGRRAVVYCVLALAPFVGPACNFVIGDPNANPAFTLFWPIFYVPVFIYFNHLLRPRVPSACDREAAGRALARHHALAVVAAFLLALFEEVTLFTLGDPWTPRTWWLAVGALYVLYLLTASLGEVQLEAARRIIRAGTARSAGPG
jgi:uncharacterized membrane protein